MRLPLWIRLLLIFAALSAIALGGFVAWQQQSFRRGFRDYLDQVALDRLGPIATTLATQYASNGSWEFLRHDPRRFARLLDPNRIDNNYWPSRDGEDRPPRRDDPPPPRDDPPPRAQDAPPGAPSADDDRPPPPQSASRAPPPAATAGRRPTATRFRRTTRRPATAARQARSTSLRA